MSECYHPGDIIRARMLPAGDARAVNLSTAELDLGVVYATSDAGQLLEPVNASTMKTAEGLHIKRKVAIKQP